MIYIGVPKLATIVNSSKTIALFQRPWWSCISMEVETGSISQSYLPISRGDIPSYNSLLGCVRGDPKGKRLSSKSCKCLVWSSPIMGHAYPPCLASLHPHISNVSSTSNVHHIHQQPVPISLERESKAIGPSTWYPTTNMGSNEKYSLSFYFLKSMLKLNYKLHHLISTCFSIHS